MSTNHRYFYDLLRRWGLTDFGARTTEFLVVRPFRILMVILVASVVARLGSRAMHRFVESLAKRGPTRVSAIRAEMRTQTMAGVFARLVRLITAVIALFMILDIVSINLAPLLAGAGIAGIALGLGAQSLVRDMVAGVFIIGEDQYGVGDIIDLGHATGVVEDVNLRSTRLRSADGTVWFVPNGQVLRVGNSSMEFSRALVDVPIPYGVNLVRVNQLVGEEAAALAASPEWADRLLDPPDVWGVQLLADTGPTVRVVVKTVPLAQGPVARELRRRVVDRLSAEGLRPPQGVAPSPSPQRGRSTRRTPKLSSGETS